MKQILLVPANMLLRVLLCGVGVMPCCCLRLVSNALAFLAGGVVGYRYKVVVGNLRLAFPDKSDGEIRRIAKGAYRCLFDTALTIFRIRYASRRRVARSVVFRNLVEVMQGLYAKGKDGLVLAGHYSCWEYIGTVQQSIGHQTVAAYQPLSFAPLENVIREARERFGAKMAALKDVFRVLFDYQGKGAKTMTLMVSDQSPAPGSTMHWVTLLGQPTPVLLGPERIAQKLDCAVMYLRIVERKRFRYEYELVMLSESAAKEPPMRVTQRFYEELEKDIRRVPQLWMWTHRRWKHSHLYAEQQKAQATAKEV